ncbi:MAG: ABC transporter permease [Chlamydiia bacterium]|nr:ABC transporter permease [Chlamydiia bacterium]MCB1116183.1 ABC transporter permease [Chlamydiia bacterium]
MKENSLSIDDTSYKPKELSFFKDAWMRLCANRPALIGMIVLAIFIFSAIMIPFFSTYAYYETHLALKNTAPCARFWFGTDELGRDLFIRIWWGARISLFVGVTAAFIDMVIGVLFGAFAGFVGGKLEEVMMRFTDILHSLPNLLIVILLMVVMKPGVFTIILALTITGWINMARITRGQILQIKQNDYVVAAQMLGASPFRILFRHLIPNAVGSIITTMTLTIPAAIFTEAFLSFLGLGVQAPIASWGTMASDGLSALRYYPWRVLFPASFISITMLAFNLVGDGIRDAFDPRLRT